MHSKACECGAACKYAAQGLQICCTRPANMLHKAYKYAAQGFQICCTRLASMLHKACKYAAQGLQICCTGPANMLHRASILVHSACHYAAQGLHIAAQSHPTLMRIQNPTLKFNAPWVFLSISLPIVANCAAKVSTVVYF